ncbi:MAG: peptidase, partial [Methanoregula sp.]|nr:peptidase [Methanoregula sp.]
MAKAVRHRSKDGDRVPDPEEPVQSRFTAGEITRKCDAAIATATSLLDEIAVLAPEHRTIDNTLLRFEQVTAEYQDRVLPLTIMGYVYPDPAIAAEGVACEEKTGAFTIGIYSRRDLYNAIRDQVPRNPGEQRLLTMTLRDFVRNGLALPDDQLAQVREMKTRLSRLEIQFSSNLNNDSTTLEFSADELAGVPATALATFSRTGTGTFLVTTKYPDYYAIMQNADRSDTRRRMASAFNNRQ